MAHVDEPRDGGAPAARGAAGAPRAPASDRVRPADARVHPADDRVHPADDRVHPADDRVHPADDRMNEALKVAAVQAEETGGLGRPGRPVNKRSPFFIGMTAAAGVAVTYGLAELVIRPRSGLVLIGL